MCALLAKLDAVVAATDVQDMLTAKLETVVAAMDFQDMLTAICSATGLTKPEPPVTNALTTKQQDAYPMFLGLVKLLKSSQEEIVKLQRRVEELESNVKSAPGCKTGMLFADIVKGEKAAKLSDAEVTVLNLFSDENVERERRMNNVVIFGLEESKASEAEVRNKNDEEAVKKVFEALKVSPTAIRRTRRLKSASGKAAPMVVELDKLNSKMTALGHARQLKEIDEYKKVFVAPDLTYAQRVQRRQLVQERNEKQKKLKESGESDGTQFYSIQRNAVKLMTKRDAKATNV